MIRTPRLKLESNQSDFIKFKIKASSECEIFIVITHHNTLMAEETLSIKIIIDERSKTPERPPSAGGSIGNINKNKAWNVKSRGPSPKRNSISD